VIAPRDGPCTKRRYNTVVNANGARSLLATCLEDHVDAANRVELAFLGEMLRSCRAADLMPILALGALVGTHRYGRRPSGRYRLPLCLQAMYLEAS